MTLSHIVKVLDQNDQDKRQARKWNRLFNENIVALTSAVIHDQGNLLLTILGNTAERLLVTAGALKMQVNPM